MPRDQLRRRQHDPRGQPVHRQRPVQPVILAGDLHPGQRQHLPRREFKRGLPRDIVANHLLQLLADQLDAAGIEAERAGVLLQRAVHGLVQPALTVQIQPGDAGALAVDFGQPAFQGPVRPLRNVQTHGQFARQHGDRRVNEGDLDRKGCGTGLLAEIDLKVDQLRRALIVDRQSAVDFQRIGIKVQRGDIQLPVIAPPAFGQDMRAGAEEFTVLRRQQCRQVAADLQIEAGTVRAVRAFFARHRQLAGHPVNAIGGNLRLAVEVVQRPGALDGGGHGGLALDPGEAGKDAARCLVQGQVDVQHPAGIVEAALEDEIALLAIGAVDDDIGGALAAFQRHRAREGQRRVLAQNRAAQHHLRGRDLLDIDADGQFRQVEAAGLGAGLVGRFFGFGQARDLDQRGAQLADLDPAAQQGRACPLDRPVMQDQPVALRIGDGDARKGRARGQRPLKSVDLHGAPGARQPALQKAGQEALIVLGLNRHARDRGVIFAVLCGGGTGQRQHGGECQKNKDTPQHQNACPKPRYS